MDQRKPPRKAPPPPRRASLLERGSFTERKSASLQGLGPRGPRGLGHALVAARLIDEDEAPAPFLQDLLGDLLELLGDEPTLPRPRDVKAANPLALEIHLRNALEVFQRRHKLCPSGRFDRPTLMELARQDLVDQPRFIKKPADIPMPASMGARSQNKPSPGGSTSSSGTAPATPSAPSTPAARPVAGGVKRGLT
ncbi:MAG: hypothetical protein ABIJ09_22710 [Pseudomonadota bacterium]